MRKPKLFKQSIKFLPISCALSAVMLLAACSGGGNSSNATATNTTTLAQYKAMLTYMPTNTSKSSLRGTSNTKQQSFTIANSVNLTDLRVTLFSSSNCQFGTDTGTVTMSGGGAGVLFNAGTYTSTSASNLALQTRFGDSTTTLNAHSVRFDYNYNTVNGGPGWVSADCMESTGLGNYESSPAVCTDGSPCGFYQTIQQDALLPESFQRAIFITDATTTGNMGGFAGADTICNNDVNKPKRGAASLYKALLAGNNSTTAGVDYYRSDYVTKITTATGNNLVAFGNASALLNSVNNGVSRNVWTGFTPAMTADGSGWFYYENDASHNNCLAWQDANSLSYGIVGTDNIAESQTQITTPYYNAGWAVSNNTACNTNLPIMCVQQSLESTPNIPGTLAISVSTNFIHIGESTNAVVSLANSGGITTPVTVTIVSDTPGEMGVTPASCSLTTAVPSCSITLTGIANGTATFSASATDYQSVTSGTMVVRYPVAYITNYDKVSGGGSNGTTYTQCNIGPNGLESNTCAVVTPPAPGALDGPTQIVIDKGYAYFANYNGNSYTQCQVNAYGIESNTCITTVPTTGALNGVAGVYAVNQYIYFANNNENSYTKCNVSENGIESITCATITPPNSGLNGPAGMGVYGSYIYFSNPTSAYTGGTSYSRCSFDDTGLVNTVTCTQIIPSGPLTTPVSVTFSGGYAYFTNFVSPTNNNNFSYTKCPLDANGIDDSSCVSISTIQLAAPVSVTIYDNKAYFMNQYGNPDPSANNSAFYTQCNVGVTGIDVNSCFKVNMVGKLFIPQFMIVY